jgi:hypothetical protein
MHTEYLSFQHIILINYFRFIEASIRRYCHGRRARWSHITLGLHQTPRAEKKGGENTSGRARAVNRGYYQQNVSLVLLDQKKSRLLYSHVLQIRLKSGLNYQRDKQLHLKSCSLKSSNIMSYQRYQRMCVAYFQQPDYLIHPQWSQLQP